MSKSDADPRSRIQITDDASTIASKIKAAVTDSLGTVTYDPETRPGVSNLLDLLAGLEGDGSAHPRDLVARYDGKHSGALKADLVEAATATLGPIREAFLRLKADPGYLASVEKNGRDQAREIAATTMAEVRRAIGFDVQSFE